MKRPEYTLQLVDKRQLTKDVLELRFAKPEGFVYTAGQFLQFFIPTEDTPVVRSYSLCSTPADSYLAACIKILPGGKGSLFFEQASIGQTVKADGPLGRFVCHDGSQSHFFIATGVGIAPIIGMLRDEIENKKTDVPIYLLFGLRFEEDIFWIEKLDALKAAAPNFSYKIVVSRPSEQWEGLDGRVTDHLDRHPEPHQYYLCGSGEMVKDVRTLLLDRGASKEEIHFEIF
jgi:ferredoxin-NADP reductase